MTSEQYLKLIELMIKMGFSGEIIMSTLFEIEMGKPLGCAFFDAIDLVDGLKCKTQ